MAHTTTFSKSYIRSDISKNISNLWIFDCKVYCTAINGGIITLFCKQRENDSRLTISIQTDPNHYLQDLFCDYEIEEMLKELLLQLSANIDDGIKFINDILNM